jgi:hypothetical protein
VRRLTPAPRAPAAAPSRERRTTSAPVGGRLAGHRNGRRPVRVRQSAETAVHRTAPAGPTPAAGRAWLRSVRSSAAKSAGSGADMVNGLFGGWPRSAAALPAALQDQLLDPGQVGQDRGDGVVAGGIRAVRLQRSTLPPALGSPSVFDRPTPGWPRGASRLPTSHPLASPAASGTG